MTFSSGFDLQLKLFAHGKEDGSMSRITKDARPDADRKLQALKGLSKQQPSQVLLHDFSPALAPVVPEPSKGFIACSAAQAKAMCLPSEFCAKY